MWVIFLSLLLFFLKNTGRAQNWHQVANISAQPTKPLELELNWGRPLRVHPEGELFLLLASTWKSKAPQLTHPYFSVSSIFAIRPSLLDAWLWIVVSVVVVDFWVHLEEMVPCLWVLQWDGPIAADKRGPELPSIARMGLPLVVARRLSFFSHSFHSPLYPGVALTSGRLLIWPELVLPEVIFL